MRVLIIDDDEEMRDIAAVSLEMNPDWEAATAASGSEGIRMAAECRPDVILMDSVMPQMDGAATLRLLRSLDRTRSIPVIALTGSANAAELERLKDLGALGVIIKPYNPSNLGAEVARILEESPSHARSG